LIAAKKSKINRLGIFAVKNIKSGTVIDHLPDLSALKKCGFNHSCNPNLDRDEKNRFITNKDIPPGEELTVSYKYRNEKLWFDCNCEVCRKGE
jgi:SET domain-containing protein